MLQVQWHALNRRCLRVLASDFPARASVSRAFCATSVLRAMVHARIASDQAPHGVAFATGVARGDPIAKTSAVDRVEVVVRSGQGSVKSVFVCVGGVVMGSSSSTG
eukprot:5604907-Prymnesium_polylepis.2